MKTADGTIFFKEWLPDLSDLDNPGLIEARNCLPLAGSYKYFGSMTALSNATAPASVFIAYGAAWSADDRLFIGDTSSIHVLESGLGGSYTNRSASTYAASDGWTFAEFDDGMVAAATSQRPQFYSLVGAAANFGALATSGEAPFARCVGPVGQFLVLGQTYQTTSSSNQEYNVRWSAIGDGRNWPTPNSSTAVAVQSGEQEMNRAFGIVTGIAGGDQYGLVFQERAITRMTYEGGGTVFRFDRISEGIGLRGRRSFAQSGGLTYFLSFRGFYMTDGVRVFPIGHGKIDEFVLAELNTVTDLVSTAAAGDYVYWSYARAGQSTPDRIVAYYIPGQRWSYARYTNRGVLSRRPIAQAVTELTGLTSGNTISTFTGAPDAAVFETGDAEMHRGGKTFVQGIKPLVDATTNAVTVALGYRDDLQATPTFTAETTANSRSGFAGFRNEARYHRARVTITGTFNSAQGIEFQAVPTGAL